MSRPDAIAGAALGEEIIRPVYFGFLDFPNEPVRANTSGKTLTVTGSGDADLDGFTFDGLSGDLVSVSPLRNSEGGSDTVQVQLSAAIDLDNDMLNEIGDRSNWQGRLFRLWCMVRDKDGVQQGAIIELYTGYMIDLSIAATPGNQILTVEVEGYIDAFAPASNRSYLDQADFDAGDLSAQAALGSANGTSGNTIVNNTGSGGSGDGPDSPTNTFAF